MSKPIMLATADLHLRTTNPACRIDDYFETQKKKLIFLKNEYLKLKDINSDLIYVDAGDLFDSWKATPKVESLALRGLPDMFCVPGNHEIPYHNISKLENSSFDVLCAAGKIIAYKGRHALFDFDLSLFPYGSELTNDKSLRFNVAVYHGMVWENKPEIPGIEGINAKDLIERLDNFDLIITGHNHKTFVVKQGDQTLINVGSIMRSSIAQVEHKPCFFIIYDDLSFEKIFFPIEKDVFDLRFYEDRKEKDNRMQVFIDELDNSDDSYSINFETNMKSYINQNKIDAVIESEIYKAMEYS